MGLLDAIKIDSKIESAKNKIKEIYLRDNLPWVIGYSGGKDSTCTTQIIIDSILDLSDAGKELNKKIYVISSDTMVETPMIIETIQDTISRINKLALKYHLPIEASIIRPSISKSFWVNLIGRGYPCPNQTFRWCTDRLKIEPANRFIESIINEYGEAVMILGVREGESQSRDRVLSNHTIEGKDLMRHTTQANSYVFAPIREFTKDDVWNYLLNNKSPWGSDNMKLFKLYQDSLTGEECPMIMTEEQKKQTTCGNSRFGCWMCTVVTEDKSLTGFIKSGITWLKPLLDYRNWVYSIRDDDTRRMNRRMNGSIYFSRVDIDSKGQIVIAAKGKRAKNIISFDGTRWKDLFGQEWHVFTSTNSEDEAKKYIATNMVSLENGENPRILIKKLDDQFYQLGVGPFTLKARQEMLDKLLKLQSSLENGYELIKKEELEEIQKIWYELGDINNSVSTIYKKYYQQELTIVKDDISLLSNEDHLFLQELCNRNGLQYSLFVDMLEVEKSNSGYNRRTEVIKQIKTKFSQEYLALNTTGEEYED